MTHQRIIPVLLSLPLLLAACGGEPGNAPETTTVIASTAPSAPATPTTPAAAPAPAPDPAPTDTCGVNPDAPAITDNLANVPAPTLEGETYAYHGDSNYDPCADLSYALVEVTGTTHALAQNQLMLFHRGAYLGVGSDLPQVHRDPRGDGGSVEVSMLDFEAMERDGAPNAAAGDYYVPVTFRWDGERVEPVGRIPNQNR